MRSKNAAFLMMTMPAMDAAPAVDDDFRAEGADDTDHVFECDIAPDFSRLLWRADVAGIFRASEELADAVVLAGGEKLFGANDAELVALLGADGVLSTLSAGDGEEANVGVEAVGEIREEAGPFVVGMGGDEENAGSDAGFVDGFDAFGDRLGDGARSDGGAGSECGGDRGKQEFELEGPLHQ